MASVLLVLALALPGWAQAPLDPASRESLEKRLFLLERAADRGDCQQAIDAAALIVKDFGEVPGAQLGRAHALACQGKWVEAWALTEKARADKYDTKELEERIKPHVAILDFAVRVDGQTAVDARFAPVVSTRAGVVPVVNVGPGVYRVVVDGDARLSVSSVVSDPTLASPAAQQMVPTLGTASKVTWDWKSVPIGALELVLTVDGQAFAASDAMDVPKPVIEFLDGSSVQMEATGLGAWRVPQVAAGSLRVRVPGSALTDAASVAVEVVPKGTARATVDVKRFPMATLTRPSGLDPAFELRVGDRALGSATPLVFRAGDLPIQASWKPAGEGAPLVVSWSQSFPAGEGQVDMPWAHVVQDEDGRVIQRGFHAPSETGADLTGVRVALPGVSGADLKVPLDGALQRVPGAIVGGTVTVSGHPVYAARGGKKRKVRRGLMVLGAGAGVAAGFGGWMALEAGKAASAASDARAVEAGEGQATYEALVSDAESATSRANVALGAAAASALLGATGWGLYTFGPGPDVVKAAETPLAIRTEAR